MKRLFVLLINRFQGARFAKDTHPLILHNLNVSLLFVNNHNNNINNNNLTVLGE